MFGGRSGLVRAKFGGPRRAPRPRKQGVSGLFVRDRPARGIAPRGDRLVVHASLATTAIYTHVAIRQLKEVHDRTHPGAKLGKTREMPKTAPTSGTGALFSTLADEAREEERE